LLILVFISWKIFKNIESYFFTEKPESFLLIYILIIGFTPAMIIRAVTIGNSILPTVFIAAIFYFITKKMHQNKEITKIDSILFGALSGASLLSKLTTTFIIPTIILFLLIKKGWFVRNLLVYIITITIMLLPWIVFNMQTYNTFTANNQAQELYSMIVNPKHENIFNNLDYIKTSIHPVFLNLIWLPEETNWSKFLRWQQFNPIIIANYLNIVWVLGIFGFGYLIFTEFYLKNKINTFLIFSLVLITVVTEFSQQVIGTLINNWPMLHGRYFHSIIVLVSLLAISPFLIFKNKKYLKIKQVLAIALFLLLIFLNVIYVRQLNFIQQIERSSYLKKNPQGNGADQDIWNISKTSYNIERETNSNYAHSTTSDPQIIVDAENLNGLTFSVASTGTTQLYYLLEGESDYQEKFSDTIRSKEIILNVTEFEKIWKRNLIRIRIDPTNKKEAFEILNLKIYQ